MAKFADVALALQGRRAVKHYPFPQADGIEVGIRLLTDDDLDSVRCFAVERCKQRHVDLNMDPDFLDRCVHRYIIQKAFLETEKHDPFFKSFDEVSQLDNLLVRTLYELYIQHQQAMDPYAYLSREGVDSVVEQLGKSASSEVHLNLYDAPTLRTFVLSMAQRLRETSQTPK